MLKGDQGDSAFSELTVGLKKQARCTPTCNTSQKAVSGTHQKCSGSSERRTTLFSFFFQLGLEGWVRFGREETGIRGTKEAEASVGANTE